MSDDKMKHNPQAEAIAKRFEELVNVMFTLRSPDGCPWDRAQSLKDLRQYLLEETYEVLDALDRDDAHALEEELGDLLLQVVFLAQIMQERDSFTLLKVLDHLVEKLIARHPHVFGSVKAGSPDEALQNWEAMKIKEAEEKRGRRRGLLEGVPASLPALLQANLISAKVARVGFDWDTEEAVWEKLREEINEFREAKSETQKEEEMGDLLFTIVNIARKNKINPEDALRSANAKFRRRFEQLEERLHSEGKTWSEMKLAGLDAIWDAIKEKE